MGHDIQIRPTPMHPRKSIKFTRTYEQIKHQITDFINAYNRFILTRPFNDKKKPALTEKVRVDNGTECINNELRRRLKQFGLLIPTSLRKCRLFKVSERSIQTLNMTRSILKQVGLNPQKILGVKQQPMQYL
jgi:hypothetical protein